MSKVGVIGHIECPVCDHADAFVKEDKSFKAYIVCPDCGVQCFTRNEYRDKKLRAKMRPVPISTVQEKPTVPPVQQEPAKRPVQPAKAQPVPKPQPTQKKAPALDPAPLPPKKRGWLQPLIGSDA